MAVHSCPGSVPDDHRRGEPDHDAHRGDLLGTGLGAGEDALGNIDIWVIMVSTVHRVLHLCGLDDTLQFRTDGNGSLVRTGLLVSLLCFTFFFFFVFLFVTGTSTFTTTRERRAKTKGKERAMLDTREEERKRNSTE